MGILPMNGCTRSWSGSPFHAILKQPLMHHRRARVHENRGRRVLLLGKMLSICRETPFLTRAGIVHSQHVLLDGAPRQNKASQQHSKASQTADCRIRSLFSEQLTVLPSPGAHFFACQAPAQSGSFVKVAPEAQSPDIREITLPTSFCYRLNMIGIPKAPPAGMHAQSTAQFSSFRDRQLLKTTIERDGIQTADRADPPIPSQYLLAQVTGIGPQSPLANAIIAAECPVSLWYF